MSQIATSSWGGTRKRPLAFTEHGAIMAATVPNSPGAVEMSVLVVRAFMQFRTALLSTRELSKRLDALERRQQVRADADDRPAAVFEDGRDLPKIVSEKSRPLEPSILRADGPAPRCEGPTAR
ncbi:MAG: hypothetical protein IPF84_05415 [Proteobacteria bacterium]|nr:hypothetical protein [Pseudomonadota bacterium]